LLIPFANAAAGIRQETGSGKPTTGCRRNDLRAWSSCRLKLGHELHGRGLHMVWA
jgi:hypothetical protein